nr:FAD-binding oxidoreductase [Protofrankia coriariae]
MDVTLAELVDALPAGVVVTDPDLLEKYRRDRAGDPAAGVPLAAVRAESTEHVRVALGWAARHRVPVVPRGAGTGLSGGATAVDGGIVLSTERMRAIEINPRTRMAVVQPGLLNAEVKAAAAAHGLWYPPTRRPSRSARSAATWRRTPVGCAASSTASPPTMCSGLRSC